jgi:hypothetical protein
LEFTLGTGFTKIEKVRGVPEQEFDIGVTVNTLIIGTFELAVLVVNASISPAPVRAGNPIRLLLCVQLYTVLATLDPVNRILLVIIPLHLT